MLITSKNYDAEMDKPFRNQGHMEFQIDFQEKRFMSLTNPFVYYTETGFHDYCNPRNAAQYDFDDPNFDTYMCIASFEKDYLRLDNRMRLKPADMTIDANREEGAVAKKLFNEYTSSTHYRYKMQLPNSAQFNEGGITIDWGINPPKKAAIWVHPVGETLWRRTEYWATANRETMGRVLTHRYFLSNADAIMIEILEMKNPYMRPRIRKYRVGNVFKYYNDEILEASLTSTCSPVCEYLPQTDLKVGIRDSANNFQAEGRYTLLRCLSKNLPVKYRFGIERDDESIEWNPYSHLYLSNWKLTHQGIEIEATDILRNVYDFDYKKGEITYGLQFGTLASKVFAEHSLSGISEDLLQHDNWLYNTVTRNALPKVKAKEAFQLIANATKSVLTITSTGGIRFNHVYSGTLTCYFYTTLSKYTPSTSDRTKAVVTTSTCVDLASFAYNATDLTGDMLLPSDSNTSENSGYIFDALSNHNGDFEVNPKVELSVPIVKTASGHDGRYYRTSRFLKVRFGNVLPKQIKVTGYNQTVTIDNKDIKRLTMIDLSDLTEPFTDVDITFVGTQPNSRISVLELGFDEICGFNMTKQKMTSQILKNPVEQIRDLTFETTDVIVKQLSPDDIRPPVLSPYPDDTEEDDRTKNYVKFMDTNVKIDKSKTELEIEWTDPYEVKKVVFEGWRHFESRDCWAYSRYLVIPSWIWSQYADGTDVRLQLYGNPIISTRYNKVHFTAEIRNSGTDKEWNNPMINTERAKDIASWIREYFTDGVVYEYETRGYPEIQAGDVIRQEMDDGTLQDVFVEKTSFNFKESFSGSLTTRSK